MKKQYKSLLALLLVLVLALSAACSVSSGEIKEPGNVNGGSGETGSNETGSNETPSQAVSITETVLYEADGVKVTATGYEEGLLGPEVKLLVENSSDKNVLLTAKSVSVNGYMAPTASLYADVAAGKKSNEGMTLMSSELEQCGITTVAEIQFYIQISDSENWSALATSDLITLKTSAAGLEQPVDDSGDVLYNDKDIRIICKGLKQDLIWDGTIVFFMENKSGKNINIYAENVSVNGFMEDVSLWSDLRAGTMLVDGMHLLDLSDLDLESIDDVKSIEFDLRIVNSDNWKEIDTSDTITLNFE